MNRYQEVMQRFLDTERSVMLAYLSQGRSIPVDARPAIDGRAIVPSPALPPPVATPPPVVAPPQPAAVVEPVVVTQAAPPETAAPAANGHGAPDITREQLTAQLLEVVSERTGYPTDMLDLDADLEADLSIDSIKRVEIAGTIVESLPLAEGTTLDAELMSASRTLREVIDVLDALVHGTLPAVGAADAAAPPDGSPVEPQAVAATAASSTSEEDDRRPFVREPADTRIGRFVLRAVPAAPPGESAALAQHGSVVIVDDTTGVGAALAERLRGAGHEVVLLAPGDEATGPPAGVKALVHLGAVGGDGNSLMSLFTLAKRVREDLVRAAARGGAAVLAATRMGGTFAVDGDRPPDAPQQGMLAGFLKTLALEWPEVRVKAVDVGHADAAAAAEALASELMAGDGLVEVGYRDGERMTLQPVAVPSGERPESEPLDGDSVLLVTGGARGITATAALALARRYRPSLVLVGRTELTDEDPELAAIDDERALKQAVLTRMRAERPDVAPAAVEAECRRLLRERQVRETLAELRECAAAVEYRVCDVRDEDAFAALVDDVYATYGRIDGAIHGAGVIEDKLVADKDAASFERVVRTKVAGAQVLARRLRSEELRFLVLFSSVSGRFGNRGQADYAAASEALNKLAQRLDEQWLARVVAINWGPWLTTGMVSEQVRRQFAERGVELIPAETGCRMLDEELRRGRKGEAEVVIGGAAGASPAHALLAVNSALSRGPGGRLAVDRTFELEQDAYLADHRIDGRPIVPYAFATELMAEVAASANPELEVDELSGVRLLGGIAVDDGGVPVRIVAEPAGADATDVTIVRPDAPARPLYRARASFRAPGTGSPAAAPAPLADPEPFPMAIEQAYAAYLFHGPLFQNIVAIEGMDGRGASAVVRSCPPSRCLAGVGAGSWWLDPVAFDCALQLQVLWARINWGVTLLPAQIGTVRSYAPLAGESVRLELRIRPESRPPMCHADHFFLGPDGATIATLTDAVGAGSKALNRLAGPERSGRFEPSSGAGAARR
jgi:NAD(P)-dependent dehydrogenase (short-subunit alcohol dehydrogenase family)